MFYVIEFHCQNCGQKIKVPPIHAGKKAKCPKCGHSLVIPMIESPTPENKSDSLSSVQDLRLKEVPPSKIIIPNIIFENNVQVETPQPQITMPFETEKPPVRKLPPILEIILYPASLSGLLNIVVFWMIGIFFRVTGIIPMIIIFRFIAGCIITAYLYSYITECIRDSAVGGTTAPDNLQSMPDSISDAVSQLMDIIASVVIFFGPVIGYIIYQFLVSTTHFSLRTDFIFCLLLGFGIFFYPMGLLAIVMFNSSSAYNPFLWIVSIFSTFFQYCGLLLSFCVFGFLVVTVFSLLPQARLFLFLFGRAVFIYLAMIAAHLLGRFYYKNSKNLNWDV
jgi:DNA-directed RNA polymerase subunit RPC12/RpoP